MTRDATFNVSYVKEKCETKYIVRLLNYWVYRMDRVNGNHSS